MEDRFKDGLRGEEYNLLKLAYTHFDEFQNCIAEQISSYAKNGMKILEIGTGIATTLEPTLNILGNKQVKLIATDISSSDLVIAQQCIKNDKRVTFIAADIFELLPLIEANSFDVIYTGWTLHNFTQTQRKFLFFHIKRILKTKGLFVNGDRFAYDDEETQTKSINEQLQLYKEYLPSNLCEGWSAHILDDENWKFTESEQASYLKNGRFIYRLRNEGIFVANND